MCSTGSSSIARVSPRWVGLLTIPLTSFSTDSRISRRGSSLSFSRTRLLCLTVSGS